IRLRYDGTPVSVELRLGNGDRDRCRGIPRIHAFRASFASEHMSISPVLVRRRGGATSGQPQGGTPMRFMMLMIPGITEDDWMPSAEAVAAMTKYNEELTRAGVLLALDGLHPTS